MTAIDIMIDLETFSTKSNALMTVLGAAVRDPSGEIVTFEMAVDTKYWERDQLHIDPETVKWWLQQSQAARDAVTTPGLSLPLVCGAFNDWINQLKMPDVPLRLWGNAASFDNVILRKNYEVAGINPAWGFRDDMCYRTLKNLYPQVPFTKPDTPHKASSDAEAQLIHLEALLEYMNRRERA